jgi:hypothetical protein
MNQNEAKLVSQLAALVVNLSIEKHFTIGPPAPEGHPQHEVLKQRFQPLLAQLEDIANARGDDQTSSYKALQELLKQLNTLHQS